MVVAFKLFILGVVCLAFASGDWIKASKFIKLVFILVTELIILKPIEQYWLFDEEGNQSDANFCVDLQKYIITATQH